MSIRSQLPQPGQQFPTTDVFDQGHFPGDGSLRIGGQNAPGLPQSDENLPSAWSKAAKRQQKALELVRDLSAGPERIRERSTVYLPKAPGEDQANYNSRLARSVFFNVFAHTIKGLVGQVFRRNPALQDDVPAQIKAQAENIDLAGTHLDVFARDLLQDGLTAGHCAILVEFPRTGGAQNPLQEQQGQIRPYWVPIAKDNIVSWRTATVDGHTILTQVVIKETTMEAAGAFGEQEVTRYRVLYNDNGHVGFELLQVTDEKVVVIVDQGLYPTQDEIPLAEIVTSGRTSIFDSTPPLLSLAYLNVAHYQQWSDYATSIHKTCVPLLVTIGMQPTEEGEDAVVVGPNSVLDLPVGGDAKYVSHNGAALAECQKALDDLKSDMGTLGISMLAPQKRTAETAQAKQLDKATEDSALAVTARGLEDGIERALGFHAKYLRLPSGGSISINKIFDAQTMQADMLTAWTGAVANAGVPARFMLEAMQSGELIDEDEDVDEIAAEMEANAQAAADAKVNALQDQLTLAAAKTGKPAPKEGAPAPEPGPLKNAA